MTSPLGEITLADRDLLQQAGACADCRTLNECSESAIAEMARARGADFATALLYDRVLQVPRNHQFFRRVESGERTRITDSPLVGIIPGAFHREHRNTGADGSRLAGILDSLNCRTEVIPVESFGSLKTNAGIIADWIRDHRSTRIALVSLSKGSADLKVALGSTNAATIFHNVETWISVSGLVEGTPLVGWLRRQALRRIGVHLLLWMRRQRYSVVEELRSELDGPLAAWPDLPPHLRVIHVVGFPLRQQLAHPWASRAYDRLAPWGPSDGGGFLLANVGRLPGTVFPVWGADHYLEPAWDATSLFRRLFIESLAPEETPRQAT